MNGASKRPSKIQPETSVVPSNHNENELTALITLLITEIKTTLNTRIDLLHEKIDLKNAENRNLKEEVQKLKQVITKQQQTIEQLQHKQLNEVTRQPTQPPLALETSSKTLRGIKAHNLILDCPKHTESDPKKVVEKIFREKFHRIPVFNAIQVLNVNTRRRSDRVIPETNSRGNTDATSEQSENYTNENYKILLNFNSVWECKSIYRERIQALRNSNIYISEDLSREESQLFYTARQLKKTQRILNTWTEDGQVFIKENIATSPKILKPNDPILDQMKIENIPTNILKNDKSSKNEPEETGKYKDNGMSDAKPESCESSEEIERKKKKKKVKNTRKRSELIEKYDENESTQITKIRNMSSNESHINIINSKENCEYKKTQEEDKEEEEEESEVEEEEGEEDDEEEKEELKKMIAAAISGIMTRASKKKKEMQNPNKTKVEI